MDLGATWYKKGKGKKGKRKGKGKRNKGKGMAATGTTTATTTDKEILSKDNKGMAKEKDTATKKTVKDTTTTNKEEKEQKESKRQMFGTDVDSQDIWPNNAGTVKRTTATTGTATQMQQLALPQPPQLADSSAVPISGFQEVTLAMIVVRLHMCAHHGLRYNSRYANLSMEQDHSLEPNQYMKLYGSDGFA